MGNSVDMRDPDANAIRNVCPSPAQDTGWIAMAVTTSLESKKMVFHIG